MEARTRCCSFTLPLFLAALACGCARTEARVTPDTPALDMPLPPARVVATISPEVPQPVGAPTGAPSGIDGLNRDEPARPAVPAASRPSPARAPEPPKPDVVAGDVVKPTDEPRAPQTLQTGPAQQESAVEAAIRVDLGRASSNLSKVDYQRLNSDARSQYELAKGYLQQAESELRAKNLPLAKTLVEKALTLAAQLGR